MNELEYRMKACGVITRPAQDNMTTEVEDAEWKESDHPRKGGKFAPKGQGETSKSPAEQSKRSASTELTKPMQEAPAKKVASVKSPTQQRLEKELLSVCKRIDSYPSSPEKISAHRSELNRLAEREETLARQLSKHTDIDAFYRNYETTKAASKAKDEEPSLSEQIARLKEREANDGGPGSGRKPDGMSMQPPESKARTSKEFESELRAKSKERAKTLHRNLYGHKEGPNNM